jgi:hypothetical protein
METRMTIDLKPEQQRLIDLAFQSGASQSANEALDQAFADDHHFLIVQ